MDLDTLLNTLDLKNEIRTGWEIYNVDNPESVTDHSWSVALLCMIYGPDQDNVDVDRAVRMAVVHDLAEAETGDIATRADKGRQEETDEAKHRAEQQAIKKYSEQLGSWVRELWQEFEAQETPTARFVRDMDKIEMVLQALQYTQQERYDQGIDPEHDHLDEFYITAQDKITTDAGKQLFHAIKEQYEDELDR